MKSIYLDNAATTPLIPEVMETMHRAMQSNFGNPSSTHHVGRLAKSAVETARKSIAKHFNIGAGEIIFTAGGTEADNLILFNAVNNLQVDTIITTRIEHHAVLHTIDHLEKTFGTEVLFLDIDTKGNPSISHLETLLSSLKDKTSLVSLMYVNNEIGNLLAIQEIVNLCQKHQAYFHTDAVQAIGHYQIDLKEIPIDFLAASAHKFHGPKGVGFAYFKKGHGIKPMLHGGDQEKGARSSTENVHSILGMETALSIAMKDLAEDAKAILEIKKYCMDALQSTFPTIRFNGDSGDLKSSSYTILNAQFPTDNSMLIFQLDLAGIAVSGGSACQSGSSQGSHVLAEILNESEANNTSIRFSFSKFTSKADIDYLVNSLQKIIGK
uniref:cysteine desulfurase family protein n=1 Tax=Polaribacter sp. TaxID=1920175 RepID=UPI0040479700